VMYSLSVPVSSCSDANFSAVGALLLSAMQKAVNEIKNVSMSLFLGCVECMKCSLLLPMCVMSVGLTISQSVCYLAQLFSAFSVCGIIRYSFCHITLASYLMIFSSYICINPRTDDEEYVTSCNVTQL